MRARNSTLRPSESSRSCHCAWSTEPRLPGRAPGGQHIVRDFERRQVPAKLDPRRGNLVRAERGAMGRGSALLVGRAKADDRLAANEARPRVGERFLDRAVDGAGIEPIAFARVPLRGLVPGDHVLVARQIGRAVDGDVVVVPQHDQPAELEMPGEPDRFVVDALHQIAVAGDDEGAVIDQVVAVDRVQMALGDGHSDGHRHPLAERPGGHFDPGELEILGVAGGRASQAGGSA